MAISFHRVFRSVLISYRRRSKAGDCVQSQLTNISRIKEPRTDSPWKRQILKARSVSYLFPSSWVLWCVFRGKFFGRFLVLDNLTCAQEPRWLCVAWWTRTFYIRSCNWIIPNIAHAQSVDYLWVGRSTFCQAILVTRIPWVYVRVHHATCSHRGL